jgi:tetratricopeptide (TPR) repeat protein
MESLIGIGRILLGTGQADQADPYLRQAVELGERSRVSAREQARLYYWLCEALFWVGRPEEQVEMAERGLALVEPDGPSVEVALMNQEIAVGSLQLGQVDTYLEFTHRTAQFLEQLPYTEELRPAYDHVASMYAWYRRQPDEAMRWLVALREQGERHHDLRALAQSHDYAGLVLATTGDPHRALEEHLQALELCDQVGDRLQKLDAIGHLVEASLAIGELEQAGAYAEQALEAVTQVDNPASMAWAYWRSGRVAHALRAWDEALQWFEEAASVFRSAGARSQSAMMMYYAAAARLHKGQKPLAVQTFEEAAALAGRDVLTQNPLSLVLVLTAIESAGGSTGAFEAFCEKWKDRLPPRMLEQWSLAADEISTADWTLLEQSKALCSGEGAWAWVDPLGGSACSGNGALRIQAVNGRGLWDSNLSAPRLLCSVDGDCAIQAVCAVANEGQPAIGGLVLWASRDSFVSLVWGFGGPGGLVFRGYVGSEPVVSGRGWLPSATERIHLRIECFAGRVRALCSADSEQWYQVGQVDWAREGPVQIGPYAIGEIDRLVYPGVFRKGTAIAFQDLCVWGRHPAGD